MRQPQHGGRRTDLFVTHAFFSRQIWVAVIMRDHIIPCSFVLRQKKHSAPSVCQLSAWEHPHICPTTMHERRAVHRRDRKTRWRTFRKYPYRKETNASSFRPSVETINPTKLCSHRRDKKVALQGPECSSVDSMEDPESWCTDYESQTMPACRGLRSEGGFAGDRRLTVGVTQTTMILTPPSPSVARIARALPMAVSSTFD